MNLEEKYYEIRNELWGMRYSGSSLKKAQELLLIAETMNDLEFMFRAHQELMDHANFTGNIETFMSSFAWCRAMVDQHSELFSNYNITWKYKWAIRNVLDFPQVTLEKVEEMYDDLKKRSGTNENSISIATLRIQQWRLANEPEKLKASLKKFQTAARDGNSDCSACLADIEMKALLYLGEEEQALKVCEPIIAGRMSCAEVPHYTYGYILESIHKTDPDLAKQYHLKGFRMVKQNTIDFIYRHINYLVICENLSSALDILEKQIQKYKSSPPFYRLCFADSAVRLFSALKAKGKEEVAINLPATFKKYRSSEGHYSTGGLYDYFHKQLKDLSMAFDERNGNSYHMDQLARFD